MNERIEEIAERAGFKTETWRDLTGTPTTTVYKEALGGNNLEKFAELLVKECMYVGRLSQINNGLVDSDIKDHFFGVE